MVGLIVQSFDVEEFPSRRSARSGLAWLCKTPGQTANQIVQIYFISKRLVLFCTLWPSSNPRSAIPWFDGVM